MTSKILQDGTLLWYKDFKLHTRFLKNAKTPADAFKAFEIARRKKVDYIVNNSWSFGKLVHSGAGQLLLKGIMKMTPEKIMSKQMDTIYTVKGL